MEVKKLTNEDDLNTKLFLIESFFEKLERRTQFLSNLFESGHNEEALLLCCCYIEGFGNWLYGKYRPTYNFVRVLKEYGEVSKFSLILPEFLKTEITEAIRKRNRQVPVEVINILAHADKRLYTEDEILALLQSVLNRKECEQIKRHFWRGTLAVFAYRRIRSENVHWLVGPTKFAPFADGTYFPEFEEFYAALSNIVNKAKQLSLNSRRWFGHDERNTEP